MRTDPWAGLLKDGRTLNLPSPARESAARKLQKLGLLRIDEHRLVRCVNPLDHDQIDVKDSACAGVCILDPRLDEDDDDYRCQACGRLLYPSEKRAFARLRLSPVEGAMAARVSRALDGLERPMSQSVAGLWRVVCPAGEVEICLVDVCPDRSVLHPQYARAGMIVFVVGNDRDYARHLPEGAPVLRLVDLLVSGDAVLRRRVRKLGRITESIAPAVLGVSSGLPPVPEIAKTEAFPTVQTHRAPAGSRWNEVKLYQVDGLTVQICVPGRPNATFTMAELGMASKRSRDRSATKKWRILMALCDGHGSCGWRGLAPSFAAFKMQVSRLRELLCHIIGIDEDPFMACTQSAGLRAAFVVGPLPEDAVYVGEDRW